MSEIGAKIRSAQEMRTQLLRRLGHNQLKMIIDDFYPLLEAHARGSYSWDQIVNVVIEAISKFTELHPVGTVTNWLLSHALEIIDAMVEEDEFSQRIAEQAKEKISVYMP